MDEPQVAGMGDPRAFATTHWSLVLAAGEQGSPEAAAAMAELCRTYWYPLYAYVRRKGYSRDDAQDLTQELFARFLERRSFALADRRRGRFRSFLLASLENFLAKEWRRSQRLKRGGGRRHISWDAEEAEGRYLQEAAEELSAERIYERRWALTLLEQALEALRAEYVAGGRAPIFEALRPALSGDGRADYEELSAGLGMTPGALRVAAHRLRQRYAEQVRAEVARLVQRPEDIEDEVRHLFEALR
jgi:RNA polymerase sigma-70 factor (ECF subfamily)